MYVYACFCVYIRVRTCAYTQFEYTNACVRKNVRVRMRVYMRCVRVYMRWCIHVQMYVCIYVHVYTLGVCICIRGCVCVCVQVNYSRIRA